MAAPRWWVPDGRRKANWLDGRLHAPIAIRDAERGEAHFYCAQRSKNHGGIHVPHVLIGAEKETVNRRPGYLFPCPSWCPSAHT